MKKSELTPQQFCRLLVRPVDQSGLTHARKMGDPQGKVTGDQGQLHSLAIHVRDRPVNGHREASLVRAPSYETPALAFEAPLACSGDIGKDYPYSSISTQTSGLVARQEECA